MNQDTHTQVTRLHLAWTLGVLDETQATVVQSHLDSCEDCRATFHTETEPGRRHLPAAMVASWDDAATNLSGLERQAVAEHLHNCETCRADLVFLGHRPELDAPPLMPASSVRSPRPASGRFDLRAWLFGGAGGAVAGALAAVLIMMSQTSPPPTPPGEVVPWIAPSRTRGSATELILPATARQITLTLGVPPECDLQTTATVTVLDPEGVSLVTTTVAPADLRRGTVLVLITRDTAFPGGEYRVEFRQDDEVLETSSFRLGAE